MHVTKLHFRTSDRIQNITLSITIVYVYYKVAVLRPILTKTVTVENVGLPL